MNLNGRGLRLVDRLLERSEVLRIEAGVVEGGGRVVDFGVQAVGGLAAGVGLARVCLADLAEVRVVAGTVGGLACPTIEVVTDHPARACLASQYAGWAIQEGKFFAMGSGPMRAASGKETAVFEKIGGGEAAEAVVGVLEARKIPDGAVFDKIASACRVSPDRVTLLVAPTASLAGGVQVVARSVETCLHKLVEIGFDVNRVRSATGVAPLPPIARDDLGAIGRTNDAILYGARVVLHVDGDDASIEAMGPSVPSSSSKDHGEPFAAIFQRYNHDFYAVDPHLFSPAEVVFQNVETGRSFGFGAVDDAVLARSFYGG